MWKCWMLICLNQHFHSRLHLAQKTNIWANILAKEIVLHYWICQELGCKMKLCVLLSQFFSYFRKSYTLKMLEDYPEEITGNTIYIIGTYRQPQYAVFQCPCGCGRIVELNLNKESSPSWTLKWHVLGTISFSPSIWRKDGCRSHFFLKKSSIHWCP